MKTLTILLFFATYTTCVSGQTQRSEKTITAIPIKKTSEVLPLETNEIKPYKSSSQPATKQKQTNATTTQPADKKKLKVIGTPSF